MTTTPKLKPASENPWYVLATIYGKQDKDKVDWELHKKNRKAWNTWAIKNGPPRESKLKVCEFLQISFDEYFHGDSDQVVSEITALFRKRMKRGSENANRQLPTTNEVIDFSGIHCASHLVLNGLYIPNELQIHGSKFDRRVHLEQSYYEGVIRIDECDFLERFTCSNSKICMGASDEFQDALTVFNTKFHKKTDVSSCVFNGSVQLQGNEFNKLLAFGGSTIAFELEVSDTTFSMFNLQDCEIKGETGFSSLNFGGKANFNSTVFGGDFKATGIIFTDHTTFTEVTFAHYCGFIGCRFDNWINFEKAMFQGYLAISRTNVAGRALFSNAKMSSLTRLNSCAFTSHPPKFFETILHQDTRLSISKNNWPAPTKIIAADGVAAYTRLRQIMNSLQKPEDEQFFYRQEMRCKIQIDGVWEALPIRIFIAISDFGHSIARPLIGLALIWILGLAMFWGYLSNCCIPPLSEKITTASPFFSAAGYSFSNIFAFFGFGSKFFGDFHASIPASLKFISSVQTLFGFILLFFLGLGLRNRFRLR